MTESIFKRKSLNRIKRPHKYQCTICGRMFKGKRSRDNHMIKAKCRPKHGNTHTPIIEAPIEPELVSLKPPIEHYDPQTTIYYGAPYDYHYPGLVTGNRHLRAGLSFPSDPLRRTIVRPILPKAMPSLGPIPTLSKHKYGAQAI